MTTCYLQAYFTPVKMFQNFFDNFNLTDAKFGVKLGLLMLQYCHIHDMFDRHGTNFLLLFFYIAPNVMRANRT